MAERIGRLVDANIPLSEMCYISSEGVFNEWGLFLICESPGCRLGEGKTSMVYQQQMPDNCIPEYMVLMRAKHLATHRSD